jgi:uncharacterized protein YdhG (YjbR/CyaY superfamily)
VHADIQAYHDKQAPAHREVCALLSGEIYRGLPEAEGKVWHGHPVWFLDGAKFKDASIFYADAAGVEAEELQRWLSKSRDIQWDYKNIVKRKGRLERLK